jgi:hypothetical protein
MSDNNGSGAGRIPPLEEDTPFDNVGPLDPDGSKGWYDNDGRLRGSERPQEGRCGARLWRTDPPRYCTRWPSKGSDRCRIHGNSPVGMANGNYRHGRVSKYLPGKLLQAAREAAEDQDLLSLHDELAVISAREVELVKRLGKQPLPDYDDLRRKLHRFKHAPAGRELETLEALEESIVSSRNSVKLYEGTWAELQATMERKARLVRPSSSGWRPCTRS